jgi:hypothetical protein
LKPIRDKGYHRERLLETERVTKAQALGAGPYIRKPYVMEKIGQAVRQELDKRAQSLPAAGRFFAAGREQPQSLEPQAG